MGKAIICDIDGTLSNIDHRSHFVKKMLLKYPCGSQKTEIALIECGNKIVDSCKICFADLKYTKPDWKSFTKEMVNDTPNFWCVSLIQHCKTESYSELALDVIYVTEREECHRILTECQINRWVGGDYELFMRPTKDYRSDVEIKEEIYNNEIKDKYDVLFAIDDRQTCVDLWRSLGITCLQCADGNF